MLIRTYSVANVKVMHYNKCTVAMLSQGDDGAYNSIEP